MRRSHRTAPAWLAGLAIGLVMPVAGAAPAAGTWEVISLPWQPGEVLAPSAVAADAAGNVYVGDTAPQGDGQPSTALMAGRLQMRDSQGRWTVLAGPGSGVGELWKPRSLAADRAGTQYAVVGGYGMAVGCLPWGLLRRTRGGAWETLAGSGSAPGEVGWVGGVAVDRLGRVYIADSGNGRVQRFTPWPSGDLNGDGRADARDVVRALQLLAGLRPPEPGEVEAADSDRNGRLEAADVVVLLRRLLDA